MICNRLESALEFSNEYNPTAGFFRGLSDIFLHRKGTVRDSLVRQSPKIIAVYLTEAGRILQF